MATKDETIGFIGLGAMGRGMASNCVKKGFKLVVFDINPAPVEALVKLGDGAVPYLLMALTDADVKVRHGAVETLGHLAGGRAAVN